MSESPDHSSADAGVLNSARLTEIFSPARIRTASKASTLKRMFEEMAGLLTRNSPHPLDQDTVFRALLAREQIGSTWIADGVAIPHCRLESLTESLGVILRMQTPLCVDSGEGKYVSVACGLLVPRESASSHLKVLSRLAQAFLEYGMYSKFMQAADSEEMYGILSNIESEVDTARS
ncbi:MAG: PTS sugar transporter subunit IIA [Acidiferrobacterales bacterium]|nr:PTS sugar transporter subunit IIA [Acidiferrobacterales bacterium]